MITPRRSVLRALILTAALAAAAPAQSAQPGRTPTEIQSRIQRSADLQRQALENLSDPGRAARLIANAHAELRGARSAIVIEGTAAKFKDPLLDLNTQKADKALSLLEAAADALKTNQPGAAAPPIVRTNLEQALRLTNAIVVN